MEIKKRRLTKYVLFHPAHIILINTYARLRSRTAIEIKNIKASNDIPAPTPRAVKYCGSG